jgi:hypothetical protein
VCVIIWGVSVPRQGCHCIGAPPPQASISFAGCTRSAPLALALASEQSICSIHSPNVSFYCQDVSCSHERGHLCARVQVCWTPVTMARSAQEARDALLDLPAVLQKKAARASASATPGGS